jgi:hypothetical protein
MADDDIERLIREVEATTAPTAPRSPAPAAAQPGKEVATAKSSGGGGRLAFSVASGVVMGAGAWTLGLFLPFTSAWSAGVGGATAAFVTALVAGPPRWFSS